MTTFDTTRTKGIIVDTVTGEAIGDVVVAKGDLNNQPLDPRIVDGKSHPVAIIEVDASISAASQKLDLETGRWEDFDRTQTPEHKLAAGASQIRKALASAFGKPFLCELRGSGYRYSTHKTERFCEVAQVGGQLLCGPAGNMRLRYHTAAEGLAVLAAYVEWRDGLELSAEADHEKLFQTVQKMEPKK